MLKKKKKILVPFFLVFLALMVYTVYHYIYKEHRNISSETPEHIITTDNLITEFSVDIDASENKYLNKTILVSGKISEIKSNYIVLENTVLCQFNEQINSPIKPSLIVKIKGRFIGFDNLLEEIKLDQCVIIETKN